MARPCKERKIDWTLKFSCFKPVWKDEAQMKILEIDLVELNAIKYTCYDWLSQAKSAKCMEISPSTFNRIHKKALNKIADALVNWKAIKINN